MTTMITNRRYPVPPPDNAVFLRSKTADSAARPTPLAKKNNGWFVTPDRVVHGVLIAFVVYALGAAAGIVPGVSKLYLGP